MSGCWTNQKSNFCSDEGLHRYQSYYNENYHKLSKKTYLNPQVVNYDFIKWSLSSRCVQGTNKIHINPNFEAVGLKSTVTKNHPYLINKVEFKSRNAALCEPETSNISRVREKKNSVDPPLFNENIICNNATISCKSRFKKVNATSLKNSNISSYNWCKIRTDEGYLNGTSKNLIEVPAVKSPEKKLIVINYNQNVHKCALPKIRVDETCLNVKDMTIFKSKTKIINKCKAKLFCNNSHKSKIHFKETGLSMPLKKHFHLSKFACENNKNSSVLRIAKAVRSKYKYLSNSEQYKKSKYKIDKRNKPSDSVKKKSNPKEIKDIRKLFPDNLYIKMKISPYNVFHLNRSKAVFKKNCLLRENQSTDKITKKINHFQNSRVVKIGGILYKSTITKLTLASQKVGINFKKSECNKLKEKQNYVVYVRGEKFILENNGRALKRQFENGINDKTLFHTPKRIDIGGVTYLRKSNNVLIRTNVHQARHFVNKARNKSIALLANLSKRSSMPCMIFHRFGRCNRHTKNLCMYKHDPKNIAVCKKFLKGHCTDHNCLLSHQVIQEKMATCHFFLKGLCVKENCPFLHVKLNQKAAICENFLQGYCNLGKECPKKHWHQCPEFDKHGTCNLGFKCHYPHRKPKAEDILDHKGTENFCENQDKTKIESENMQYYIHSEIQKKKRKTKQSRKLKEVISKKKQQLRIKTGLPVNNFDQSGSIIECFPKRIKLDKLPCFIPLNSES